MVVVSPSASRSPWEGRRGLLGLLRASGDHLGRLRASQCLLGAMVNLGPGRPGGLGGGGNQVVLDLPS